MLLASARGMRFLTPSSQNRRKTGSASAAARRALEVVDHACGNRHVSGALPACHAIGIGESSLPAGDVGVDQGRRTIGGKVQQGRPPEERVGDVLRAGSWPCKVEVDQCRRESIAKHHVASAIATVGHERGGVEQDGHAGVRSARDPRAWRWARNAWIVNENGRRGRRSVSPTRRIPGVTPSRPNGSSCMPCILPQRDPRRTLQLRVTRGRLAVAPLPTSRRCRPDDHFPNSAAAAVPRPRTGRELPDCVEADREVADSRATGGRHVRPRADEQP